MAIANGTTPAFALRKLIDMGGVCYSSFADGWCAEEFLGTREALVQSGVATEDMLPNGKKRKCNFGLDSERRVQTWEEHCAIPYDSELHKSSRPGRCQKGGGGVYALKLYCSDSQFAEVSQVRNRYKSAAHFKERVGWNLCVNLAMTREGIRGRAESNREGYRFSKENEILALVALIEDKIKCSDVITPTAKVAELSVLPSKRPALRLVAIPQQ